MRRPESPSFTLGHIGFDYSPPSEEQNEMARLLKLIDAEWRSDPMSVQCFDLRIIEQVRDIIKKHDAITIDLNNEGKRYGS